MDVSRIEAFRPSKIDWKSLTAREIVKYKEQGVEVPNLYYQWAIGFLNDVENARNDDVTYESAKSSDRHGNEDKVERNSNGEKIEIENPEETQETEDSEETVPEPEENAEAEAAQAAEDGQANPPQLTKAQQKRQNMTDDGASLRKMGISFTKDSLKTSANAVLATLLMRFTQSDSSEEINNLDGQIQDIVSEAKEAKANFKNVMASINENGNASDISKLNDIQQELQSYGNEGMKMISSSENIIVGYEGEVDSKTSEIFDAKDFGTETIDIGEELLKNSNGSGFFGYLLNLIIGTTAVATGGLSVANSEICEGVQTQTNGILSSNMSLAESMKHTVEVLTGVDGGDKAKADKQGAETDPVSGEVDEADKDIKSSQNDGTDTSDLAHISADEIIKRKIRKGENINEG